MAHRFRGLRNLRTLSGKVDRVAVPYKAYMQITCLEMEKARRSCERKSASALIAEIDTRLAEIEAEKTRILQALSKTDPGNHTGALGIETDPPARRGTGGFKFRY